MRAALLAIALSALPIPGLRHSAPPRGPYFLDDASTLCHLWWDGVKMQQSSGCPAFTQAGTVPMVQGSGPVRPGAGAFTTSDYYYTNSSGIAASASGFTVCAVFKPVSNSSLQIIATDAGTNRWFFQISGSVLTFTVRTLGSASTTGQPLTTALNVGCGGMNSTTANVMMNGAANRTAGPYTMGSTPNTFYVGKDSSGYPFGGVLYELIVKSTAFDSTAAGAIISLAHTKAAITAW